MITTTLNKIREHRPCHEGWTKLLKHLGKTTADDEPLPLLTILDSNGLGDALWCLHAVPAEHSATWRKYAVWCARQVEHLMTDQRSKDALDVVWKHACGEVSDEDLAAARDAAYAAARDAATATQAADEELAAALDAAAYAAHAAHDAAHDAARDAAAYAARDAAYAAAYAARDAAYAAADRDAADRDAADRDAAYAAARDAAYAARDAAYAAAYAAYAARDAAYAARDAARDAAYAARDAARSKQVGKLREILTAGEWK